jgi:hypothetical protein
MLFIVNYAINGKSQSVQMKHAIIVPIGLKILEMEKPKMSDKHQLTYSEELDLKNMLDSTKGKKPGYPKLANSEDFKLASGITIIGKNGKTGWAFLKPDGTSEPLPDIGIYSLGFRAEPNLTKPQLIESLEAIIRMIKLDIVNEDYCSYPFKSNDMVRYAYEPTSNEATT